MGGSGRSGIAETAETADKMNCFEEATREPDARQSTLQADFRRDAPPGIERFRCAEIAKLYRP
jgi:hypothetical protein